AEVVYAKDNAQKQVAELYQQVDQQKQQYAQALEGWVQEQNSAFDESHPELRDPQIAPQVAKGVRQMFYDAGIDDAGIAQLWSGQSNVPWSHASVQSMLYDAWRWRRANTKVTEQRKDLK